MLCMVVVDDPIIFKNDRLPKNNRLIGNSIKNNDNDNHSKSNDNITIEIIIIMILIMIMMIVIIILMISMMMKRLLTIN